MKKGSQLNFVFDENLSPAIADLLNRVCNFVGVYSISKFDGKATDDTVWILRALNAGFIPVTCDRNQVRSLRMNVIYIEQGKIGLYFGEWFAHATLFQKVQFFFRHIEKIERQARTLPPGAHRINKNGRITNNFSERNRVNLDKRMKSSRENR